MKKVEIKDVKEQNKVDLFNRYHELLVNALRYEGITDEEREEMMLLHMEIKDDIPRLLNESFEKKYKALKRRELHEHLVKQDRTRLLRR